MVSCATDSDGDKTEPTAAFDATNDLTVTFSADVQGVSAAALVEHVGTVQLFGLMEPVTPQQSQ